MTPSLPDATADLRLRPFVLEDAPRLLVMSHERGLREWLPDQVYADLAEAERVARYLIEQGERPDVPRGAPLVLGVVRRDSDELIGHVGLSAAYGGVEIGYAIAEAHQGRGFATQAVRAMTEWGLARFGLDAIDGIVAAENVASCHVLEKAGFVRVGEASRPMHGITRLVRTYRRSA
jgi:ribosomal-protein-alanine N-acetyltransferase